MVSMLTRNWWAFALRGLFAILFGIMALIWPALTLLTLVLLFGAYALVDGIFAAVTGIASYGFNRRWWAMLLAGAAGILIGLVTFFWPEMTALVLLYFIAAWAVITGVLEIIAAVQLRRVITGEWVMVISGAVAILFGVLLFAFPGAGALGLVTLIGVFAIIFGVMQIILAFRLRSFRREVRSASA